MASPPRDDMDIDGKSFTGDTPSPSGRSDPTTPQHTPKLDPNTPSNAASPDTEDVSSAPPPRKHATDSKPQSTRNPSSRPTSSAPHVAPNPSEGHPPPPPHVAVPAYASELAALQQDLRQKTAALETALGSVERDIQRKEETYISSTWHNGNVMRGWDPLARPAEKNERTAQHTALNNPQSNGFKPRKPKPSDRIFSLSSATSPFRLDNPDAVIQKKSVPVLKKKKKR